MVVFYFFLSFFYILKQSHKKNNLCLVGKRNDNDACRSLGNQAWTSCTKGITQWGKGIHPRAHALRLVT